MGGHDWWRDKATPCPALESREVIGRNKGTKMAYRLPKLFPQPSQLQENGFSLVCVLSCLCTCSTRLIGKYLVSQYRDPQGQLPAYLNHLLQYLQGRVLGFCCLISPFSSARGGLGPSTDCMDNMLAQQASIMPLVGVSERVYRLRGVGERILFWWGRGTKQIIVKGNLTVEICQGYELSVNRGCPFVTRVKLKNQTAVDSLS